jgi:hypothetical protein
LEPRNILFTDWLAENRSGDQFQISGVAEVKSRIREFLESYKVYGKDEKSKLKKFLNAKWQD